MHRPLLLKNARHFTVYPYQLRMSGVNRCGLFHTGVHVAVGKDCTLCLSICFSRNTLEK